MNKIRRFFRTAGIYFVGNILSKLVSFFLLPLYTTKINPAQYGNYDLVISLINLVAPIAFFQIWDGMFRFAFEVKKNKDKYQIINDAMIVFGFGLIPYILLFSGAYIYFQFEYFSYAIIYGMLFAVQYIYTYAARLFLRNKLFVFSGTANTILTACSNIFLIVVLKWDVRSLYFSAAIGTMLQIIIIESRIHLFKNFSIRQLSFGRCRKMLKFSVPLCIATISYWLLSGFTKVMITKQLGAFENGLYAVSNRFSSMITIFVNVFQFAWNEMAYLMADEENRKEKYNLCVGLLFKTIMFGSAIAFLVSKLIFPFLIADQYSAAIDLIPISIIGVALNSMAGFLGTLFMTEKKTSYILYSTVISAAINIVLGFCMVEVWGLRGIVSALSIAFAMLMIIRLLQLRNRFAIKIGIKDLMTVVLVLIAILTFYCNRFYSVDILVIALLGSLYIFSVKDYIKILIRVRKYNKL